MNTLTLSAAKVNFAYIPVINFAFQQNHVPVIREFSLQNQSDQDWSSVSVEITTEHDFADVWRHNIDSLSRGEIYEFKSISLNISSKYLAELTERIASRITVIVKAGGDLVFQESYPVDLLAYDQWSGIGLLPQMLSAFITPNHPEISKIIRKASAILEKWTGNPSFDEYQSRNPDRVRKQMAAIYEAIAELQVVYCSVPASFEETGQRVRLADNIFMNKLGNCLDLSLLYGACLEATGIHPLVVIVKGHAFVGGWLVDESFADAVNDDPSLITKRIADGINEITVVEATCMNAGNHVLFDEAVKSADYKVRDVNNFVLFIDIKRARFSGIRPLPLRIATSGGWEIVEKTKAVRENTLPEEIFVGAKLIHADKVLVTKQRLWERKLLDLTLRNSLLNVRITKSVIQFITVNAGQLEDALAGGQEFQVLAKPADWDNPIRDAGLYQSIHSSDPVTDLVKHELSHNRLRTYLSETELNSSLTNIYRSAKLSIEENGANTLYIGLGLLKWFETEVSEKARYAPILLIPVEIIRKSAQKGYVIRSREEETVMNITLLEMIRQDFGISIGGLDTLPKDDSGVDVRLIFNIIRQAIMAKTRWDVEEQVILGTFSFSKFILWNDIHNNSEQLCRNKVVASLVSGKLEWQLDGQTQDSSVSDEQLHPSKIVLPISTDSSQLKAIVSSGEGKSFVLHGPPGTGKSQTITNIIANALYAGKKVLFVAAKKAALEVVQNRLNAIGLGPFCLELHSNKSKKSAVLEQLKESTLISQEAANEYFNHEADRLNELRNELNVYVEALHRKYHFGYSLFDLFSGYGNLTKGEDKVYFPANTLDQLFPEQVTTWNDLAEEIQTIGALIGQPKLHPLNAFNLSQYTPQLKQDAKQELEKLTTLLKQINNIITDISKLLNLENAVQNEENETHLANLIALLADLPDTPPSLLQTDTFEQTLAQIIGIAEHGQERDRLREELLNHYQKGILTFPAEQTFTAWNMAAEKWFLPRWLQQSSILKSIKRLLITGDVNKDNVSGILQQISAYQDKQEIIDKAGHLAPLLGYLWNNGDCKWTDLIAICNSLILINRQISNIVGITKAKEWRLHMAHEFAEGSRIYTNAHMRLFKTYLTVDTQLKDTKASLTQLLGINFAALHHTPSNWITDLTATATQWMVHLEDLKDWFNWLIIKQKANHAGLQPLVDAYENGSINNDEIILQFKKGFYRSAAEYILEKTPSLASFNSTLFEEKIKKFRVLSNQFEVLTKKEVYARLAAKVPSFTQEASQSSEIGMLQRNIRNNGRAMSIRKIFDSIPNLLHRLKPCMLMSPISVAQYFDANSVKFDLVIFDEASQMPTCEAVGAIARGSNVIVVGDPKQMPPTNFFSTNNVDEDNIEKEDLESILDDCLALSMPSQHLLWHYRSKHESLIAFSNAKYYENKLLTFPSTDDIVSKVQFIQIEGYYDKGKTRQNKSEAKAIVDEVTRRLSDPVLAKQSMGIVTFSSVQQILIDDMLTDVFRLRPDLEKIAIDSQEPLFIKNLENVQGDERDVILFSVGYGPDQDGKVSLNFGPINREGGWRRLNVAVSRARYEMKVFSTVTSDQIDINRTNSEGVAGLKAFLAYAEKGKTTLPIRPVTKAEQESSFEHQIADKLKVQGYNVHKQIGCSAYKIDLGIVDRDNPSEYILGILTDGKNYYNAQTARDREIVQTEVLKALSWTIHKVWSTEWWEKPDKALANIIAAIKSAEEEKSSNKLLQPLMENYIAPVLKDKPVPQTLNSITQPIITTNKPVVSFNAVQYETALVEVVLATSAEDFLMPHNRAKIKTQIFNVLQTESPISKNLLCKRVLTAWGISRMGSRVAAHFESLFSQLEMQPVLCGKNSFFWKKEHQPTGYLQYRIAEQEFNKRDADDLPPEEVANGVKEILKNQISLSKVDLIRETSKLFGYARIGANVENAMLQGINKAIERGNAHLENERVTYLEN